MGREGEAGTQPWKAILNIWVNINKEILLSATGLEGEGQEDNTIHRRMLGACAVFPRAMNSRAIIFPKVCELKKCVQMTKGVFLVIKRSFYAQE